MLTERERLILLNLIPNLGSTCLRRLLEAYGSPERLFRASAEDLQRVDGVGEALARRIIAGRGDERLLHQELERARAAGVTLTTCEDADYPPSLKTIHDPPLVLYVRGTLAPTDGMAVAIVGSRRASLYGLQSAERLAYDLALRGVTVVSGLARGIDAAAHQGALKAGGRTLAVLGNGLARIYPPEHEAIATRVQGQGALISEYPMGTAPFPFNFPRRNRLISGLSLGVVVVEAASRSGALITVDCALEQGRDVFAVPGPMTAVTSQGTHQLLKQGARLVTSVEDILEELRLAPEAPLHASPRPPGDPSADDAPLPELEQRVFACVKAQEPAYVDAIASRTGLALPQVSAALLQLELKRLVRQLPGQRFVR